MSTGRPCTVCNHADLDAINTAIIHGETVRAIAAQYGTTPSTVQRHKVRCLAKVDEPAVALAGDVLDPAQPPSLKVQLERLHAETMAILTDARSAGRLGTAVMAIDAARKNLELLLKLSGELDERPQINILIHPDWLGLKAAILAALDEHPMALESVSRAIAERAGT